LQGEKTPLQVADIPDHIVLKRHRDFEGRRWHIWLQRGLLLVLVALVAAALANVFGQVPTTVHAQTSAARMELYAPDSVRGGLLYETRLRIHAYRDIKQATLRLDGGWLEGFTLNSLEPSPLGEASHDGKLVFTLGHIPAGETYTLYMEFQVNATNVGIHHQGIVLLDGQQRLAELKRSVTTYP
jgi:hypothetical protein